MSGWVDQVTASTGGQTSGLQYFLPEPSLPVQRTPAASGETSGFPLVVVVILTRIDRVDSLLAASIRVDLNDDN